MIVNRNPVNAQYTNTRVVSKQSDNDIAGYISTAKYFATLKTDVTASATINSLDSTSGFIRITGSTNTALNGISSGLNGKFIIIYNSQSANNVTIANESGSASVADQIITPDGSSVVLTPDDSVMCVYDSSQSKWIVVSSTASLSGFVTGTGTDNHIVRWNGTGVAAIQDSTPTISDAGTVTISTVDVIGLVVSSLGDGIVAAAFTQNSNSGFAVLGTNSGSGGVAIYGQGTDAGTGLQGSGDTGVIGTGDSFGVNGSSGTGVGTLGSTINGIGVQGLSTGLGTAVYAQVTGAGTGLLIDNDDSVGDAIHVLINRLGTQLFLIDETGLVAIGNILPSNARLSIEGGDAASAPLQIRSGTSVSSPVSGNIEYDGSNLYFTDSVPTRRGIVTGPSSATDTAIAKYDGTTGKKIQDTGVLISSGNKVLGVDGDFTSPSYSFISDPDTGIYLASANVLGFATGGGNKVEISTTLVDVVIPLRVGPEADETAITASADGSGTCLILDALNGFSNPLDIRLDGSTVIIVDVDGQVGIGTSSCDALLDVRGSVIFNQNGNDHDVRMESENQANMFFLDASTDTVNIALGTAANGHLNIGAGTTSRAPLNLAAGTVVTSPVSGNIESDGLDLYWTNSGDVRDNIPNAHQLNMGVKFIYNSASSVALNVESYNGVASIPLWDLNTGSVKIFRTTTAITASLASSGANGLDTGSETSSTFYYVWGIGKLDGTFALLLSLSATAPTMPAGYTYKRLLWGVANDGSSNIFPFVHLKDGTCYYTTAQANSVRGAAILNGGTSTSFAAVSMAVYAPDIVGTNVQLEVTASNASNTNSAFSLSEDSSGTVLLQAGRTVGQTGAVINAEHWYRTIRIVSSAATSLYYDWSVNSGSQTSTIYLQSWNMGGPTWF